MIQITTQEHDAYREDIDAPVTGKLVIEYTADSFESAIDVLEKALECYKLKLIEK